MTNLQYPKDAAGWAKFLLSRDLPSISPRLPEIVAALDEDRLPYPRLAELISHDPVLSYRLLAEANRILLAKDSSVSGLTHAITMLGSEKVRRIAKSLLQIKPPTSAEERELYSRVLMTSLFAARYAQALSPLHQPAVAEELYWNSLQQGVPFWYLARHGQPLLRQLDSFVPRLQATRGQQVVFGCKFDELARACLQKLPVPYATSHSIPLAPFAFKRMLVRARWHANSAGASQERSMDDRDLQIFMHQPSFPISLANMLAWEAMYDWYSPSTLKLLQVSAVYVNQEFDHWVNFSHRLAAEVSRNYALPGAMSAGQRLLLAPRPPKAKVKVERPLEAIAAPKASTIRTTPTKPVIAKPGLTGASSTRPTITPASSDDDMHGMSDIYEAAKEPVSAPIVTPVSMQAQRAAEQANTKATQNTPVTAERPAASQAAAQTQLATPVNTAAPAEAQVPSSRSAAAASDATTAAAPNPSEPKGPMTAPANAQTATANDSMVSTASDQDSGSAALFTELTDAMLKKPASFTDLPQLMNSAVQAACFGIGLERAVIALVNTQRTRLKAFYAAGVKDSPDFAKFEVDLEAASLFRRMIEKPAGIWIKPSSSDKVWSMVPESFLQQCQRQEFMLMSLFMPNKPVAVIYADKGAPGRCTESDYARFKLLCQAVSHVLLHMAQRAGKT